MLKFLSFDNLAESYEETRSFDTGCFQSALEYVAARYPVRAFSKLFEPGIGTGRIAIPLAESGYEVTGVDVSEQMLKLLHSRLSRNPRSYPVNYLRADVTGLPFRDGIFDMAFVVHLFYFIQDWKKAADEILRVVKQNGPIILMHTGTGTEIPRLNQRYKELCQAEGSSIPIVGVSSTQEVRTHYEELGCKTESVRNGWQWTSRLSLDKAMGYIKSRAYSFTTFASEPVHMRAIEQLEFELLTEFGRLSTEVEVQNEIYVVIVQREAGGKPEAA